MRRCVAARAVRPHRKPGVRFRQPAGRRQFLRAGEGGCDERDVDLTPDGDVLTISGEKKLEREEKDEKGEWFMSERSCGSFGRSFTLPFTPSAGAVDAEYRQGVLHVTDPEATR